MTMLFDKKYYKEIMRQLSSPLIAVSFIMTVVTLLYFFITLGRSVTALYAMTYTFDSMILLAPIAMYLAYYVFGFMHNRQQCDFYHSLYIKRNTMFFTNLVAVITCLFSIIVICLIEGFFIDIFNKTDFIIIWQGVFTKIFFYFINALFVLSIWILAISINGNKLTSIITAVIVLLLPRILLLYCTHVFSYLPGLYNNDNILSSDANIFIRSFKNIMNNSDISYYESDDYTETFNICITIIYSVIVSLIYFFIAFRMFCKRKSEWAGDGYTSKGVYYFNRVLLPVLVCISGIVQLNFIVLICQLLVAALLIFLYDSIVCRKLTKLKTFIVSIVAFICISASVVVIELGMFKIASNMKYDYKKISAIHFDKYEAEPTDEIKIIIADAINNSVARTIKLPSYYSASDTDDEYYSLDDYWRMSGTNVKLVYDGHVISDDVRLPKEQKKKIEDFLNSAEKKFIYDMPNPDKTTCIINEFPNNDKLYAIYYKEFESLTNEQKIDLYKNAELTCHLEFYNDFKIKNRYLCASIKYTPEFVIEYCKEYKKKYKKVYEEFQALMNSYDNISVKVHNNGESYDINNNKIIKSIFDNEQYSSDAKFFEIWYSDSQRSYKLIIWSKYDIPEEYLHKFEPKYKTE